MSNQDIFDFWDEAAPHDKVHPRDREVFTRLGRNHGFDLNCLPACFGGPLRTASVVLLCLSPGWAQQDVDEADTLEGQARYAERRKGNQPLRGPEENRPAWEWWSRHTQMFGPWEKLRNKVAVFNIGAYHSRNFTHKHVLAALPSCRASITWAQNELFREAESGRRVVVCLRAARFWGLSEGRHGKALFVPAVTRSGHMITGGQAAGAQRDEVIGAVKSILAL